MARAEQAAELIELGEEQRQALERRLRRPDLTPRERERLEMIKAAALGQDLGAIEAWSGRTERTVRRWLGQYRRHGLEALADAPRSGRPVRATPAVLQALEAAVETPPAALGLAFDVWTSARLAAYLKQQTGVRLSAAWVRALLNRRDWVCGRPKHTLKHLQNAAAVAASRAELAAVGEKGTPRPGAPRAALPGRDAPGDQSVSLSGLASAGPAGDAAGRRYQSPTHGVWQRRSSGAWARGTGARRAGQRRLRSVSGGAGGPAPRAGSGDLSGAR
jgi:transposase